MASSNGSDDQLKRMAELSKTLKEGERIVAPTRRPDGTLRKPIRIRAGYVPQEEVAIYQSKGALVWLLFFSFYLHQRKTQLHMYINVLYLWNFCFYLRVHVCIHY